MPKATLTGATNSWDDTQLEPDVQVSEAVDGLKTDLDVAFDVQVVKPRKRVSTPVVIAPIILVD